MAMDQRDYIPNCAICGRPGEPECPCEGERLELCVNAAEKRWIESWVTKIRFVQLLSLFILILLPISETYQLLTP